VFWFTFEANESKRLIEQKKENSNSFMGKDLIKDFPKILLVDDNAINLFVASEILRKAGCDVDTAGNGLEAIQKVHEQAYRIVLMDIQMPQMDGIAATAEIRKLNLLHTPPIIAMTAYSMKEDKERFISNGMDDYIAKPIKADILIDKVKQWLNPLHTYNGQETEVFNIALPIEDPVLDKEVFEKLTQLSGVENIQSIYKEFEGEALEQIEACKKSLESNDFHNILNNLHTLKGVSGTLGLTDLESKTRAVEAKLKIGNYPELEMDLNELEKALNRFKEYYPFFITT
ncbi:MAG: response regulator, partial [Cytophagales bacterium]|nr:response regulator [Cytophaga sp.]